MSQLYFVCDYCGIIEEVTNYVPEVLHLHSYRDWGTVQYKLLALKTEREAKQRQREIWRKQKCHSQP